MEGSIMSDKTPKYAFLVNWIKQEIIEKQLNAGTRFYSETELAEKFEMSRQTVRQAVGILEQAGYLERRRGSGTYVSYGGPSSKRELTKTIGVITTYLDSYIFPNIIRGIDKVLVDRGYTMQLSFTHNKVENESAALKLLMQKNVDGLIVEPTKSGLYNPNRTLYDEIFRQNKPLVFVNSYYPDMNYPRVCMDDYLAGNLAARCLIDAGHTRIAGIFQSDDAQGHRRYSGYVDALTGSGLAFQSSNVLWFTTEDIPYICQDFDRVERCLEGCTGVVCYNDQIAYTVASALRARSIAVPDDISVVGVDNAELATMCEVPLTTLNHPKEKLGEMAAQNILRLIEDPSYDATVIFEPVLVERSSVKKLK